MEVFPLISFFMGVFSILSPCILPVLPVFVGFCLKSKSKLELLSFILGLFCVFTLVIFMTAFFTVAIYRYISYFRVISALILLIIGILILTDYSFSFSYSKSVEGEGILESFSLGLLTSIAWAPCYGAYLISLISLLVTSADPFYAAFNILIYCTGFALTMLVLSLVISKVNMDYLASKVRYIPKIFAVLIIISALYMLISLF